MPLSKELRLFVGDAHIWSFLDSTPWQTRRTNHIIGNATTEDRNSCQICHKLKNLTKNQNQFVFLSMLLRQLFKVCLPVLILSMLVHLHLLVRCIKIVCQHLSLIYNCWYFIQAKQNINAHDYNVNETGWLTIVYHKLKM